MQILYLKQMAPHIVFIFLACCFSVSFTVFCITIIIIIILKYNLAAIQFVSLFSVFKCKFAHYTK